MPVQGAETVACPRVPQLYEVILAARDDKGLVRVPLHRLHVPSVPRQSTLLFVVLPVPNTHLCVEGTRDKHTPW